MQRKRFISSQLKEKERQVERDRESKNKKKLVHQTRKTTQSRYMNVHDRKKAEKNHWQQFFYLLSMFAKRKVLNDKKRISQFQRGMSLLTILCHNDKN